MVRTIGCALSGILLIGMTQPAAAQRAMPKSATVAPLSVAANTVTQGVVLITWPVVQKAAAYEVMRCEGTACAVKTSPRITAGQPLEFQDNLTASGTYLYRVTAFGSNQLPLAEGEVAYQYTAPATVLLAAAPTATAMVTPAAGPAQLTAVSLIPGQIELTWPPVSGAMHYRVLRSSSGGEVEHAILTFLASAPDKIRNGYSVHVDGPIDFRWTYTYKVQAVWETATGLVYSASSPAASAKSLPFVQVTGLTYTAVPSITTPGRVDVTVRWNAVQGVLHYYYWDEMLRNAIELSPAVTSRFLPGFVPGGSPTTVCVGAVYPFNVRQDKTAPCIVIKL